MPKEFWTEVVNTATNSINSRPFAPLGKKISQEVWTGKEVTFEHLRTYWCAGYMLKTKDKWDKLDPKSEKLYFIVMVKITWQ